MQTIRNLSRFKVRTPCGGSVLASYSITPRAQNVAGAGTVVPFRLSSARFLSLMGNEDDFDFREEMDPESIDMSSDEEDNVALTPKKFTAHSGATSSTTIRLMQDPWDLDEMIYARTKYADLPDWSPEYVSRPSKELVNVHPSGILSLSTMASLPLPPLPPPHPSNAAKAYALYRKRKIYEHIRSQVESLAAPRISSIKRLDSWEDKQDAVDVLFESIETELKEKETIIGRHPNFETLVDRAMEDYLRSVSKKESKELNDIESEESDNGTTLPSLALTGEAAVDPLFMDCFDSVNDSSTAIVPKILSPLRVKANDNARGRMVEEWSLAALKTSKRILLRRSTLSLARLMTEDNKDSVSSTSSKRIVVHGERGVGKTAALAAIVASARSSGCIVLFMPDGDDLHRHGYYIEPNYKHDGIFDLPILSQQTCEYFLGSHEDDLSQLFADTNILTEHFTESELKNFHDTSEDISLSEVLKWGVSDPAIAPMCISTALDVLVKQDKVPFWMVFDEFNCFYEKSHYFHVDYDFDVKKPIPYEQISLFRTALQAMNIPTLPFDESPAPKDPTITFKRGGILVATSESRSIARKITNGFVENVKVQAKDNESSPAPIHLIEILRLSPLEIKCMIANYEATGVGKLRLDQGETLMDTQEMDLLRMVSGGVPQKLLDACIM